MGIRKYRIRNKKWKTTKPRKNSSQKTEEKKEQTTNM